MPDLRTCQVLELPDRFVQDETLYEGASGERRADCACF